MIYLALSFVEVENNSSLSMQIVLFFNVYLAPVWTISSLYFIYITIKQHHSSYETVLSVIFLILAIPMEYGRLYLGYSGNLRERVSTPNTQYYQQSINHV